jgi:hypothetical protein
MHTIYYCPLLVACSAHINNEIEKRALETGFDFVVESPLTIQIIEEFLIVQTLNRRMQNK